MIERESKQIITVLHAPNVAVPPSGRMHGGRIIAADGHIGLSWCDGLPA